MAKIEMYRCEQCREIKNRTFIFEGSLTKVVLNAPTFLPSLIKTEVCSVDCLVKKIRKQLSRPFEDKPPAKRGTVNGKSETQKNNT